METPWDKAKKTRSQKQEAYPERRVKGAQKQPNSGRGTFRKGDSTVRSFIGRCLIDHKTHDDPEKVSYTLTARSWRKTQADARITPPGCHPLQQIDLQDLHLMVMETDLWHEIEEFVVQLQVENERLKRDRNATE